MLAPKAKLWALVVPNCPEQVTGKSELTTPEPGYAHGWAIGIPTAIADTWGTAIHCWSLRPTTCWVQWHASTGLSANGTYLSPAPARLRA